MGVVAENVLRKGFRKKWFKGFASVLKMLRDFQNRNITFYSGLYWGENDVRTKSGECTGPEWPECFERLSTPGTYLWFFGNNF